MKELNENKQYCPKCYRPEGCAMKDYCPCHQEEKVCDNCKWNGKRHDLKNGNIIMVNDDGSCRECGRHRNHWNPTPSQEENHSIHCECLKCFTEEPPKEEKEVLMGDFLEEMKRDISTPSQPKTFRETEILVHQAEASQSWEEEFNKRFGFGIWQTPKTTALYSSDIVEFIRSLLATKIEIHEVVGMIDEEIRPLKHIECTNGQHEMCDNCLTRNVVNARLLSLKQKLLALTNKK